MCESGAAAISGSHTHMNNTYPLAYRCMYINMVYTHMCEYTWLVGGQNAEVLDSKAPCLLGVGVPAVQHRANAEASTQHYHGHNDDDQAHTNTLFIVAAV